MRKAAHWIADHRELVVGVGGGLVGGALFTLGQHVTAPRFQLMPTGTVPGVSSVTNTVVMAASLIGQLITPIWTTFIARRRPFLWGLLPLTLFNFWCIADTFTHPFLPDTNTFRLILLLRIPAFGLLFCGPVALFRWRRHLQREHSATVQAAQQEQSATVQEGVWPPPPRQ